MMAVTVQFVLNLGIAWLIDVGIKLALQERQLGISVEVSL